jgi:hypothetical protein
MSASDSQRDPICYEGIARFGLSGASADISAGQQRTLMMIIFSVFLQISPEIIYKSHYNTGVFTGR